MEEAGAQLMALRGSRDRRTLPAASTLQLLRKLEKLKRQKFDLENRIRAEEVSVDELLPENFTEEFLTETIESIRNETEVLEVTHHNKSLSLRRLQIYDAIQNKLCEGSAESQMIYANMKHTRGLCDHIHVLEKEAVTLEQQSIDIKRKRMELRERCTTLMAELRNMREKGNNSLALMSNPEFKKINEYIKKETDIVTVIQDIFQRLILGSGVNWAEDPKLKEIVLKMGKNRACS